MLPDGRRVNYGKGGVTIGAPPVALGARVNPNTYHQPSNSALTNSFLHADAVPQYSASAYGHPDEQYAHQPGQNGGGNGIPTIDTTYTSNPTTAFGSPRADEDVAGRFGLGVSPAPRGLSVLDAPLPASFDSNGISHAARYGPFPSSVPERFGLESSSLGMSVTRDVNTSRTLLALRSSAFGGNDNISQSLLSGDGFANSPPTHSSAAFYGSSLGGEDIGFGRRPMHSSSSRFSKPRLLSQSVPHDRDWDSDLIFDNEEDYVPGELANELLTPAERARRGSSTATVRGFDAPLDSTGLDATKFGSPVSQSPSRWGPLFQRQKEEEEREKLESNGGSGSLSFMPIAGRSIKHPPSAFGHVGSPLRNSSLASAFVSEDNNRQGSLTGQSLSALTQQFQRTQIGEDASIMSSSPRGLHPNLGRNGASGAGVIGKERGDSLQRHISSNSVSSTSGRFATPIINEDNEDGDEEQSEFVFSMEDEDDTVQAGQNQKRNGNGNGSPLGNGTGSLGNGGASSSPWGSYAGATTAGSGANGDESKGQNGQNGVSKVGAVGAK